MQHLARADWMPSTLQSNTLMGVPWFYLAGLMTTLYSCI